MIKFLQDLKKIAKKSNLIVRFYQKLIGYNPEANMWCRIVMDKETEELLMKLPFKTFSTLEISGKKWSGFGFQNYTNVQYPNFDICKNKFNKQYDMIIAEQVFEHLQKPFNAGRNVYNHLKPGGYFLITTPFMIKIHPSPDDCTRWSKTGIKYFLEECGFKNIDSFSWGNKACVKANFKKWVLFNPKKHSLTNEEEFPLVVWALARKEL